VLKLVILFLFLTLVIWASSAQANLIEDFQATGTFANGASLSGTLSIDTTAGVTTASNLTIGSPISAHITIVTGSEVSGGEYILFLENSGFNPTIVGTFDPLLDLYFNTVTLVNYVGGPLATDSIAEFPSGCCASRSNLSVGSLSPAPPPVDEPRTLALLASALIIMGGISLRQCRRRWRCSTD
jgi:hypothetical protein